MHLNRVAWFVLLGAALTCGAARGEVFNLHDGGQIRGELVNRDESPRKTYVIKTASGGSVTLDAEQVKDVRRQSAAEMQYDRIRSGYPDTVEGQWKLAEWCRENRLPTQRKVHLERVIELNPDHAPARHALGYAQMHGRWARKESLMAENGYVRYKGSWVLPQEVEILEAQRKEQLAQAEWTRKLKRWHSWFGTERGEEALAAIKAIDDPSAAKPLIKYLNGGARRDLRTIYVEALGHIDNPVSMAALVDASLYDADDEIRLASLDQVVSHQFKPAVTRYTAGLKHKNNLVVNRAAYCLSEMKDPAAIGPLIDALVTKHTFVIQRGSPGGMGATFGQGPGGGFGGLSVGSSTQTIVQRVENRDVLRALVSLSGGTNFDFDVHAWKYWLAAQKKPASLDARRDDAKK